MRILTIFFPYILFVHVFAVLAQEPNPLVIKGSSTEEIAQECARFRDQLPFQITDLTYHVDSAMMVEELFYLTDLSIGKQITITDLNKALKVLFQKNKFKTVTVTITDALGGKQLHIAAESAWTLHAVKVSGVWVGRDWYKQYYLLEPGDQFDTAKHEHSLEKMKDACKQEGFFNVKIDTTLTRDETTKAITVHLVITRGVRFKIRDVELAINADESVSVDEVARLKQQVYKKYLRDLVGNRYAKRAIQEQARSLKLYLLHKGFLYSSIGLTETINRQKHTVVLTWHVDLHKKRSFVFFGNRFFSNYQLLDRMLQFGRSAWILPASILAEELVRAYHAKGFWQVQIDVREEGDRSFFVIKEGIRAIVDEIQICNAHYIPERMTIKHCFSKFKRPIFYDQDLVNHALDEMVAIYLKEGFLHSKIISHECVPHAQKNFYSLVVTVAEGVRMYLDSVKIPEFPELESQGPFGLINNAMRKDSLPFDIGMVHAQKRWLLEHFQREGFLHTIVKPDVRSHSEGTTRVVWQVTPGQKIQFGKTIIQGSSNFPYEYVMRELQFKEGDPWDHEQMRKSFLRLKDLQLFDFISFTPLATEQAEGVRPVLLKLHEDDPFELRLRAGLELQHIQQYQTFDGLAYRAGGTFIVKNISNHADQFRFDVDLARSHREVTLKYWYPWIFSLPCNATLEGYSIKYDQPGFIGSSKNIYNIFQNGFLLGLQRKMAHSECGVNLGFEVARTTLSDQTSTTRELACCIARAINLNPALLDKRIPFIFIEPTLMLDLLDNKLNPRSGCLSLVSLKGMFPTNETFIDAYFVKLLAEHSWFVSLGSAVSAFRVRIGHLFHRVFSDIIPSERFYLGGAHSIRSYETDLAPPVGCCIDDQGKRLVLPRGGKTMFNVNVELRIPTLKQIYFAIFQDWGILAGDCIWDDVCNNIAAGTGFGVRYFTPIGPLRLDLAWKWKKQYPEEGAFNWFLTFGQAF